MSKCYAIRSLSVFLNETSDRVQICISVANSGCFLESMDKLESKLEVNPTSWKTQWAVACKSRSDAWLFPNCSQIYFDRNTEKDRTESWKWSITVPHLPRQ